MPLIFLHRNGKLDPTDAHSSTKHFNIHRRIFTGATRQAGCEVLATPPDENGGTTPNVMQVIDPISRQHTPLVMR